MTQVSEKAILTLLEDPDRHTSIETMRLILQQYDNPLDFISRHQDDESPRIRRHTQQLSALVCRKRLRQAFINGIRSHKMSFWDAVLHISVLSDCRSNLDYLNEAFQELLNTMIERFSGTVKVTTGAVLNVVKTSPLAIVLGPGFFEFDNLLLSEVLGTGHCHPLLFCEILRQLGTRIGWHPTILMHAGLFMLGTPEDTVLSPEKDWNIAPDIHISQCHVCTNDELISAYLALLQVCAIVSRKPMDIFNISTLLAELNHTSLESLPYPIGTRKTPPPAAPNA